jgi:hypothetical protein
MSAVLEQFADAQFRFIQQKAVSQADILTIQSMEPCQDKIVLV